MVQSSDDETQPQSDASSNAIRVAPSIWSPITNESDTLKGETLDAGKRQQVSIPSSIDPVHGLTILLSRRLEGPLSDHRLVHPTYPFINIMTYRASQKKAAHKLAASSQPPETTPHSEASPVNVPDKTKAESSGAQNNVKVGVRFVRLEAGAHNNSCSEKLGDHRRTRLIFPFQCRYPPGFAVAV